MRASPQSGFTLLETMVAGAALLVGTVAALSGIVFAFGNLREGPIRQYKSILLDAKAQRVMVADKTTWLTQASTADPPTAQTLTTDPTAAAIGTAPWVPDPSAPITGDLGTGAYFRILPDGEINHIATIAAGTPCNSVNLPPGTFCREVLLQVGTFTGSSGPVPSLPAGVPASSTMTYWSRISRVGEPLSRAVVHREVIVQ